MRAHIVCTATATAVAAGSVYAGALVRTGVSADAAGLTGIVDTFRGDLGQLNGNNPGSLGSGRRQIDWDAVPDAFASPNAFPGDFFNAGFSPRARGAVFSTPGSGFEVSAKESSGQGVRFSNINASYATKFSTFSPERLFTALGSNVLDVEFFIPGSQDEATTRGFGVVFTDVDYSDSTFVDFLDASGNLLDRVYADAGPTAEGSLSFVGVSYADAIIGSVRIYSGNAALGGDEFGGVDLVVMDDFIFGEPVPAPASLALVALAGAVAARRRR